MRDVLATFFAGVITILSPSSQVTVESGEFIRTQGVQTNVEELTRFAALSGGGTYATSLTSLLSHASTASSAWPHSLTAGDWEADAGDCEPVGAATTDDTIRLAATDIFALALAGYLQSNATYSAAAKTHIEEFEAMTGFSYGTWSGANECALHLGSAVSHIVEAAWLLEEGGYDFDAADRLALAEWIRDEAWPVLSYPITQRKNNWAVVTLASALAAAAYVEGGIPLLTWYDTTTISPTNFISIADELLTDWKSNSDPFDGSAGDCSQVPDVYGLQDHGGYPDELRRSVGTADCPEVSIAFDCTTSTSCGNSHFYQQKATLAVIHINEILRRLDGNGIRGFDVNTHGGAGTDAYDMANFATGGDGLFQDYYVHDNTQGIKYVLGEYLADDAIIDALVSGTPSVRGGRDYAYTKITHAPGVAYDYYLALEDSPLYGTGGSIVDMTTRVAPPFPLELIDTTASNVDTGAWTVDDEYEGVTDCSSITITDLADKWNDAVGPTVIHWPSCVVEVADNPATSAAMATLSGSASGYDDERIFTGVEGVSGLHMTTGVTFDPDDVSQDSFGGTAAIAFQIGSSGAISPIVSCALTTEPALGSRVLKFAESGSCDVSGWGNGDIIRVRQNQLPSAGSNDPVYAFRVTGKNADGTLSGSDTSLLTAGSDGDANDNTIQISDPLPLDASWDTYHFSASTPGTVVDLVERIGSSRSWNGVAGTGTETNNVPEFIGFRGIEFTREYYGAWDTINPALNVLRGFDLEVSDSRFMKWGSVWIFIGSGTNDNNFVGRMNIFDNHFQHWLGNASCFGSITGWSATNPARATVRTSGCATFASAVSAVGDHALYFSPEAENVPEQFWARPTGGPVSTGAGVATIEVLGVDGTAPGFSTAGGGFVANIDDFSSAGVYCKNGGSNIQMVNNSLIDTYMGYIVQDGCSNFVWAGNYVRHDPDTARTGRNFPHGNSAAPGLYEEMNDQDLPIVPFADSNGCATRGGESMHRLAYKNRLVDTGPNTFPWPDQKGRGRIEVFEQPSQCGASNEAWSFLENVFDTFHDLGFTRYIDDADNLNAGTSAVAPYMLRNFAWYRNRCTDAACNLDAKFDRTACGATGQNPTTLEDVCSSETGEASETVPAGWSAEVRQEPTSIFWRSKPTWWPTGAVRFGEMGAKYDDVSGAMGKLPAQLRCESDGDC
jgi:hypothetical protein